MLLLVVLVLLLLLGAFGCCWCCSLLPLPLLPRIRRRKLLTNDASASTCSKYTECDVHSRKYSSSIHSMTLDRHWHLNDWTRTNTRFIWVGGVLVVVVCMCAPVCVCVSQCLTLHCRLRPLSSTRKQCAMHSVFYERIHFYYFALQTNWIFSYFLFHWIFLFASASTIHTHVAFVAVISFVSMELFMQCVFFFLDRIVVGSHMLTYVCCVYVYQLKGKSH